MRKRNQKPITVPEVSLWTASEGSFRLSKSTRIVVLHGETLAKTAEILAEELLSAVGLLPEVVLSGSPRTGDIVLELEKQNNSEEYLLEIADTITVAGDKHGVIWGTKTLLQLAVQYGKDGLPKGRILDKPRFPLRGFMLDVGRKPFSLKTLESVVKGMSRLKLNDFHIHLNDNYIWLEDYEENPFDAYSGFRLESSVPGLTSKDRFYTKREFKAFVEWAAEYGVHITVEIDVPAHSLAFTKVRRELALGPKGRDADHFDINNPQSLAFVKEVLSEYLDGEDAVFKSCTVHIGTDEYSEKHTEAFRRFTDDLIRFVRDEKGYPVRLWGSLTARKGKAPVSSTDVEMNIWSDDWGRAGEMHALGFKLINILDKDLYIVPGANYYRDYLNTRYLYKKWQANRFNKEQFSEADPQILGGAYAVWNDLIDKRDNGLSEQDVIKRAFAAMPAMSEKLWGYAKEKSYRAFCRAAKCLFQAEHPS